jgi:hypothetical protein
VHIVITFQVTSRVKMSTGNCIYMCIVNNTDDKTFDPSTLKPNFDSIALTFFVIATLISLFGYFGNFLLIFSTWRKGSSLKSKSNQLIAHSAVAEVLACVEYFQAWKDTFKFEIKLHSGISGRQNAMVRLATNNLRKL